MIGQHLVGLVSTHAVPADFEGDVIACGAVAAATRPARAFGADRDRLDHHASVVAWCRRAAFLPSRGGIAMSPALLRSVRQSAASYSARLEHVAGRVELAVAFGRRDDRLHRAAAAGGRAYLRAAALDLSACEVGIATAGSLLAMFAEGVDAELIVRTAPLPAVGLRAAVLVRRAAAPRLAQKVETTLNAISGRLACRVTGPWPPYSFSTIGEFP